MMVFIADTTQLSHNKGCPSAKNVWDCAILASAILQTRLATPPISNPSKIKWGIGQTTPEIRASMQSTLHAVIDAMEMTNETS